LPHGSTFVDGGAHFGDTVITMALYARETLQRTDLRFVAIEPNRAKAEFIRDCAAVNGLETVRVIECVLGDETALGSATVRKARYCEYDGRNSYEFTCNSEDGEKENRSIFSSADDDELYDIRRLDDFYDLIHPLGFLHLDVEGWEAQALNGASALLSAPVPGGRCYVLAECFTFEEARRRGPGFSLAQEHDIMSIMNKFPDFIRGEDLVDEERNLLFVREGS
jgi:FkbM family methyltransferase